MNAIFSCLLTFIQRGDAILLNKPMHTETVLMFQKFSEQIGFSIFWLNCADETEFYTALETFPKKLKMVFLEIPTNPLLYFIDINKVRRILGEEILLIVDSTLASPIDYFPCLHGADLIANSCTKYLSGHDDIILGLVSGRAKHILKLKEFRDITGNTPDIMEAFLLNRSLKTLSLRMQKVNTVALNIAQYLESHPMIRKVHYLLLKSHKHYKVAQKHMQGGGGLIFFELEGSCEMVPNFINRLKCPKITSNFGTPYSIIKQFIDMSDKSSKNEECLPTNLIRLAVGFLDKEYDLIQDLKHSLNSLKVPIT